MHAAPQAH
jgi:hypothetical protein